MTKRERKHLKIIDAIAQVYIFLKTKAHKQARGTEEDTFRIFRSNPATCYLFFEPSATLRRPFVVLAPASFTSCTWLLPILVLVLIRHVDPG